MSVWRVISERERLHITLGVFDEDRPEHKGPVAEITIVNVGRLPAYVVEAAVVQRLPWPLRWPFRSLSFRTRSRWFPRVMFSRSVVWHVKFPGTSGGPMWGTLEPRALMRNSTTNEELIDAWVRERRWIIVSTAIRFYAARITDNRSKRPPQLPAFP